MTKPIEGWVAVSADGEISVYTDVEDSRSANIPVYLHKQPGLDYRPVLVTFMDKTAKDLIEEWSEDNEFNRGLKAMADYVESIAPELNGYIELEEGQKIENALKKERERILRAVSNSWPSGYSQMKSIVFGEEK